MKLFNALSTALATALFSVSLSAMPMYTKQVTVFDEHGINSAVVEIEAESKEALMNYQSKNMLLIPVESFTYSHQDDAIGDVYHGAHEDVKVVIKSTDFVDGVYDLRLRYNDEQQLKASWNYYDFESSKDCAAVTRVKPSRRVYAWFKSKPTANSEWEDVAYSGKIKNKVTWSKCDVGSFKTKLTVKTKKRSAFNYTFYNN